MADTTAPLPSPIPLVKKPNGNTGRKPSEKQLEALRGGMAKLKAMRDEVKKKKEEKKARKERGEPDSSEDEAPAPAPAPAPPKPIKLDVINLAPVKKPRKPRSDTGVEKVPKEKKYATREDFEAFKTQMFETIKTTPLLKEVEKPVDRIVEKEVIKEVPVHTTKVMSGSDLLNSIFFK
jgi:hypothetical protein